MFESPDELDPAVRAAYLARLGLDAGPPSVEGLVSIVQRQVERVPYETLWIPAGERWSIDPVQAARRIAFAGRGGYCYHLNGALGLLLRSLGYAVHGHVGAVHGDEPSVDDVGNHLVLTVTGLPCEANPSGRWYVDAGLGDALHEPLPLVPGDYLQAPFRLTLETAGDGAWRLIHDPVGGFRSMTWTAGPAAPTDFTGRHEWLSTSPDSGFVQVPMAERRDATGVDVIRGLVLARLGSGAFTADPVTRPAQWFDTLADVFGLRFDGLAPDSRRRLWDTVLGAHRAWEASRSR
ncbi:MAG: arylamine N-acetyltransferase [Jatrophihabitans sp.]|nr:MAG: arylamine N-acetyltransferase [Jatrophihabitans sp.]